MNPLRRQKDLLLAALFGLTGYGALAFGADLRLGVARAMGPGYFPRILAFALIGIAGLILLRAIIARAPQALDSFSLRPLLAVLGGAMAFALTLKPLGLVVAIPALVLVSKLGEPRFALRQTLALAVALTLGSVLVFVFALGQPIPVMGWLFAAMAR